MENTTEDIDAECNVCDWKGMFTEMKQPIEIDDVHKCPVCGKENLYYFNQPPRNNDN